MRPLLDAFNRLPRAARWLVLFGAFLALYFGAIEGLLERAAASRAAADALESKLARERAFLAPDSEPGRELDVGMASFGVPNLPTDRAARPEALQRAVNAILNYHGVDLATYNERSGTIRSDDAAAVAGSGSRLERFVLDVAFDADPSTVLAVLADLEQASEVTAVSRVKIDKSGAGRGRPGAGGSGDRTVRAVIAVESWIAVPDFISGTPGGGRL